MTTRVSATGEVTLPPEVRDHLGIGPGDAVSFRVADDGSVVLEQALSDDDRFDATLNRLRRDPPIRRWTTDEIMRMTRGTDG